MQATQDEMLLQVKDLKKHYPIERGIIKMAVGHVKAVDGISFYIKEKETLGLVGESGCGKTTTGRCILRAIEPTSGQIHFKDPQAGWLDVRGLRGEGMKKLRRNMQMIFQDPYSSLSPRMTLLQIVGEPLTVIGIKGSALEERVAHLLQLVGLSPEYMRRYPHAFSGGQRQRIGIARALALNPRLIVADEAVSALDVSIQAQVLNLLVELQQQFSLTYLFIAHNLGVIRHISDRVAVMYVGKLVEMASTDELFTHPLHPYTEALLSAVPTPDPRLKMDRILLTGDVADPANPPPGCYFHPRCRYAQAQCSSEEPMLADLGGEHFVSCHLASKLKLRGVPTE
jgi:peptide/nickel transport system ATP-binding protein